MAHWDSKDFDKQASALASAFSAGESQNGADLKALATKVAKENSLNAEQIRRLCRATNVAVFGQKFAQMKDAKAPDRIVEFDVVDPEDVIGELHKAAAPAAPMAKAASYPDLPDRMAALRRPPPPAEKVASAEENFEAIRRAVGKDLPPRRQLARMNKAASELDVQLHAAAQGWEWSMGDLVSLTKTAYFDRDAFEKNALALHGVDILPELNSLRLNRKMEPIALPTDGEKVAELLDRLVGTETAETKLVKVAATHRATYVHLLESRRAMEERRQHLAAEVSRG